MCASLIVFLPLLPRGNLWSKIFICHFLASLQQYIFFNFYIKGMFFWNLYYYLIWRVSFLNIDKLNLGLPWWFSGKKSTCQCRRYGFNPWVRKIPWRRKWQPTPVFLPGKSHGQRNLAGYSPQGSQKSQTLLSYTITTKLSLKCIIVTPWSSSELTKRGWTTFSPHFSNYLLFLFVLSLIDILLP